MRPGQDLASVLLSMWRNYYSDADESGRKDSCAAS
jgi:hypothetical protein